MKSLMRVAVPLLVGMGILGAFLVTLVFLWWKAQAPAEVYETQTPMMTDIVKKTVATGAIVPRVEVDIKPRVSGVVQRVAVVPGQQVQEGDLIAEIKIIPDVASLNRAQGAVRSAKIALDSARRDLQRDERLLADGAISSVQVDATRTDFALKRQEHAAAVTNLLIVRDGAARGAGEASTQVRSTVAGMVLSVDVEPGESVIESNTFNAGTTIASVADMSDLIFEGKLDESEVGRIREGMELAIQIAAYQDQNFKGTLEYIAPKGVMADGAVQFEIRAAMRVTDDVFVRAGCSANADIVLDRRDQVLAIDESLLTFEGGKPFVHVQVGEQTFEPRPVQVGLSDGIHIEVLSGISLDTPLRKPRPGA